MLEKRISVAMRRLMSVECRSTWFILASTSESIPSPWHSSTASSIAVSASCILASVDCNSSKTFGLEAHNRPNSEINYDNLLFMRASYSFCSFWKISRCPGVHGLRKHVGTANGLPGAGNIPSTAAPVSGSAAGPVRISMSMKPGSGSKYRSLQKQFM